MNAEMRQNQPAIPNDLGSYLSVHQQSKLPCIEREGWKVDFVRRQRYEYPVVVLRNADGQIGLFEADGTVRNNPALHIRS